MKIRNVRLFGGVFILFIFLNPLFVNSIKSANKIDSQKEKQAKQDSLFNVWQETDQADSSRVKALNSFIWNGILYTNPDSAAKLAQQMILFSRQIGNLEYEGKGLFAQGATAYLKQAYPEALRYYGLCAKIYEQIDNQKGLAGVLNNTGLIYFYRGAYPRALYNFKKSLIVQKELGLDKGISTCLNNIGLIYYYQVDYDKALDYFTQSLKISEELDDKKGIGNTLGNIGNIYNDKGDYENALEYYTRSLNIRKELHSQSGEANALSCIGIIHHRQGDYPKALDYYTRSLEIYEQIENQVEAAGILSRIGNVNLETGNHSKALDFCHKGYTLAKEIGTLMEQKINCECLYYTYKEMSNSNEALKYHEILNAIEDSINSEETAKQLQQMEFAKQVLADSLAQVEKDRLIKEAHKEEVRKKNKTRNYIAGAGLLFLLLAGGFYSRWRYVRKSKAVLQVEKDRSENLLLNILPEEIAEELKEKGRADARDFDMVTIIFTDFKGFTSLSEQLTAQELVAEINSCFEAFDKIMGELGIEKIKTIGDAYMAAGGLPVPSEDSVKNCILAGLKMQEFIVQRKLELDALGKPSFQMRVGIHTGPVVAGIVGVKKFQYDIWGDTVNTASRMESSGEVGKVNISDKTYILVKDNEKFSFENRGDVEVKGKGRMAMWFVSHKIE